MKITVARIVFFASVVVTGSVGAGFAKGGSDFGRSMTAGAGISSPGSLNALSHNPAGMVYGQAPRAALSVVNDTLGVDTPGFGLTVMGGTMGWVVGAAMNTYSGMSVAPLSPFPLLPQLGIAISVPGLSSAFGVAAQGSGVAGLPVTWDLNAGGIFGLEGNVHFGVQGTGLLGGARTLGLGLAVDLTENFQLLTDLAYQFIGQSLGVQPGLLIRTERVVLTLSYGFAGVAGFGNTVNSGIGAGLGAKLSESLQAYVLVRELGLVAIQFGFVF